MERALSIKGVMRDDASVARRSRVLGRVNEALHKHIAHDHETGLTQAAVDVAYAEAGRRLDARYPDSRPTESHHADEGEIFPPLPRPCS